MEHPVSAMVALVARDLKGRLKHGVLVDTVLRGAVLVDLALSGRLTDEDEIISIDNAPIGYPPADALAAGMVAQPGRTLLEWLTLREPVQPELTAYWLAAGRWRPSHNQRRPRYSDQFEHQVAPLRWRLRHIVNDDIEADAVSTCTAALAQLAGLLDQSPNRVDADVVARCGSASWLMPMISDWAADRIAFQREMSAAASVGILSVPPAG